MKQEADKRIFVVLLAILLCFLIALSRNDKAPALNSDESENAASAFTMEVRDGRICFIHGQGVFSVTDMAVLLEKAGILSTDVEHIVLDGEITEIENNSIVNFSYLRSLKISEGTVRLHNGAVKNCPMLEYVYLPSSVRRVGLDFLSGCGSIRCIVTDFTEERLDEIWDSFGTTVLYGVNSYNSFLSEYEKNEVPYRIFLPENLMTDDINAGFSPFSIHPGCIQFGPYASIEKGFYKAVVRGKGFSKLTNECVLLKVNIDPFPYDGLIIEDKSLSYHFSFFEDKNNVEFTLSVPPEGKAIEIDSILLYREENESQHEMDFWWN